MLLLGFSLRHDGHIDTWLRSTLLPGVLLLLLPLPVLLLL
eukprot:COSAG06_NODE_36454_length_447_cov_0.735632_1_plen_39_part_10